MPLNGPSPLSQAVILTIVHKVSSTDPGLLVEPLSDNESFLQLGGYIGESAPEGETFKSSLWWLQRAATVLKTNVRVA